jgi:hypothetical protein
LQRGAVTYTVPVRARVVLAILLLLVAAGSVSYSCARTYTFVDEAHAPVDPVYVAYYHVGSRPNLVHPVSYRATLLRVVRSTAPGQLVIPGEWHVHKPFPIETHPTVHVELVYTPRLHNAVGGLHEATPARPGLFVLDHRLRQATVSDVSRRPEAWESTLSTLSSVISRLVAPAVDGRQLVSADGTTVASTRELIGHFRTEVAAFVAAFETAPRQKPEMPPYARWSGPDEQKRWAESVDADLAREPVWGDMIRRRYADELRSFEAWQPPAR